MGDDKPENYIAFSFPIVIKDGIYRHYKGNHYIVLHLARDSNNHANRETVVVYMSLSPPYAGAIHTRWMSEFIEKITLPDGSVGPRFLYIGHAPKGSDPQ